ncbi:MAG: pyrrolo-quinoline quinone [Blastopirellula sp.]|nr:pyrrolo-quinoline quinone [Blastopirellula sp.]
MSLRTSTLSLIVVACLLRGNLFAQELPTTYFRHAWGQAGDTHPLPENLEQDAKLVWRAPLLPGQSSPCVCGDSIYLTTYDADQQELATLALDRASGKLRWKQICPTQTIEPFHRTGSPACSTVACNGKQVFAFFGSFGLLAYDLQGKLLWKKPLGPFQDEFGAASSPILVDHLVILNEDHDIDSFLIAIDQQTGETVWRVPRQGFTRSYATPVVWEHAGRKQIIVAGSLQLTGYDALTGKRLWWLNGLSRIVDVTPVVAGKHLYIATQTAGGDATQRIAMEPFPEALKKYDQNQDGGIAKSELPADSPVVPRFFRMDLDQNQQLDAGEWAKHASVFARARNAAMRVTLGSSGQLTDSNIDWIYRRGLPTVPSSVVYRDALYMMKDGGIITSIDVANGKLLKTGRAPAGRGNYYASLVAGDGKVYLCSERGVVTILKAQAKWQVLSSHDFGERIMATPTVVDGQMYLRTDDALYCYRKS